jgi:hypothetical protein
VLASPACPGPQRIDTPCPDRPVVGGAVELLTGSTQVSATTTGTDGRFEFRVPPGHYTVVAHNSGYRSTASQDVDVSGSVEVTLVVDSGMR